MMMNGEACCDTSRPMTGVESQLHRIDEILSDVTMAVGSAEDRFSSVVLHVPQQNAAAEAKMSACPEPNMCELSTTLSAFADRLSAIRYRIGTLVDRAEL